MWWHQCNIIDNVKSMEEQAVKTDAGEPRVSPGPAPAYDKADFQQYLYVRVR
jgi:hypothetical protein